MVDQLRPFAPRFGAGGETYVHPAVALVMILAALLILCLPRKYVVAVFLAVAFIIPMDQVIVVGPLHFTMLRVLILLGWVRLLTTLRSVRGRLLSGGMNLIDKAVVLWAVFSAVGFVLLWQESAAVINQLGELYTIFGVYFLLRFLIRSRKDVDLAIRALAYVAVVIGVIMAVEQATGRSPYVFFGGASEWARRFLMQRGERFRAMGAFEQPILAGTFGAICFPLFFALWWGHAENRKSAILGAMGATTIVIASNSSTPLLAYGAGWLSLGLWSMRKQMRIIRWGVVLSLISLHLVMKAPVWALIDRVDVIGGSGYHRYQLVDQCIRHFGEWWLVGTKDNAQWGWDMWDTCNQYVDIGERSGLLPLIFFVGIIVYAFKSLGKARRASEGNRREELVLWALGAAVFANVIAFFGITYFDQTQVAWYALLAIISVMVTAAPVRTLVQPSVQKTESSKNLEPASSFS